MTIVRSFPLRVHRLLQPSAQIHHGAAAICLPSCRGLRAILRTRLIHPETFRQRRRDGGFQLAQRVLSGRDSSRFILFPARIRSQAPGANTQVMQAPFEIANERIPLIDLKGAQRATQLPSGRACIGGEALLPNAQRLGE